jgi:Kef-type K+ transport system membrane component KefB
MIEDLLPIGLLIVVAKLLECLLDRIGLSSIVAYTAAGIIVGLDEIDIPGFVATIRGRFICASVLDG